MTVGYAQAAIENQRGIASVPHRPERVDERWTARQVNGDQSVHRKYRPGCRGASTAPSWPPMSGSTPTSPTEEALPSGWRLWMLGARPRTLPAAVVPVAVGAAAAWTVSDGDDMSLVAVALALVVSLALQVAVNYANDYSDGVRGTDDDRVGPLRLVASGVPAHRVRNAALVAFGVAGVAGLVLAAMVSWWLIAVGVVCIAAGWGYTGGPTPYGYLGLGEVFVFVFFGLVATVGTTFVAIGEITTVSVIAGCGVGALACALLVVNNLRDLPRDAQVGKRTLAVRLGDARTRWLYATLVLVAAIAAVVIAGWHPGAFAGIVAILVARDPLRAVRSGASGSELIAVLGSTGRVQLVYGLAVTLGLVLAG